MSHWRSFCLAFRAALAVLLACAMIAGQVSSAAAHGAHRDYGVEAPHENCPGAFSDAHAPASGHQSKKIAGCPACCLLAGAATLPDRVPATLRPLNASASHILYFAIPLIEPDSVISPAVNGARAPPASFLD